MGPTISIMANEIGAAESAARQELVLDQRYALVSMTTAESDPGIRPAQGMVFRPLAVSGSALVTSTGEAPEPWFEWEARRLDCQRREFAGWQVPEGAAVALYQLPGGTESRSPGEAGSEFIRGLRFGRDEIRGEIGFSSVERLKDHRAGPG